MATAGDSYQVGPDTRVLLSYDLFDEEGELVESSDDVEPIEFVFGYAQVAPYLERAVDGLVAGQSCKVALTPEQAYGPRDESAFVELDREGFPDGVAVGDEFEAEDETGDLVPMKVLEVTEAAVLVDMNHPLAGQTVHFDLTVDSVRPATSDEIAAAAEALGEPEERPAAETSLISGDRLIRRGGRGYESPPVRSGSRRGGPIRRA